MPLLSETVTKETFPDMDDAAIYLINGGIYSIYELADKSTEAQYLLKGGGESFFLTKSGAITEACPENKETVGLSLFLRNISDGIKEFNKKFEEYMKNR